MLISFDVNGQQIKRKDSTIIIADSVNYILAAFNFSEDWEGFTKTAVFSSTTDTRNVLLNENNSCIIPWEVLDEVGSLTVSIFGVKDDILITANSVQVKVDKSGYITGIDGIDPTPTAYQQLINALGDNDIVVKAISDSVSEYMLAHRSEIKGEDGTSVTITSIEKKDGVTTITFSDGQSIEIRDGVNGEDGKNITNAFVKNGKLILTFSNGSELNVGTVKSADGKTPVKGVDYFTESDKAELVASLIESIPLAESEGY